MPIFEFKCSDCNHTFETLILASDTDQPVCPLCSCKFVEKLISAASFRPNGIPTGSGGFKPPACNPSGGG